jgi:hypothetical protein
MTLRERHRSHAHFIANVRHHMETANARIIARLLNDVGRFRRGELKIDEIQGLVLAHGYALEGAGREWRDLVNHIEGRIDMIRFTVDEDQQSEQALEALAQLEQAAARLFPDTMDDRGA